MKNNIYSRSLYFFVALVLLWGLRGQISQGWAWISNRDAVEMSMRTAGIWAPAILFILFVLQVFLAFIPGQALMLACGYLYGFWGGFVLSWFSLVVGGEIAYLLARKYGRRFAERWISPEVLSRWDMSARGQGIGFFALTLVMPLVPNDAMCYVAGLGTISRRRFAIANMLGRGMACAITSAAGAFGGNWNAQTWIAILVIFLLVGLGWYAARHHSTRLLLA